MSIDKTLFDRLGGKHTFVKVHKIFYDKVYADPWLSKYFTEKPQHVLEEQQTDFMIQLMGGPKIYAGKTPKSAHQHMMISEQLFELRSAMLSESITLSDWCEMPANNWKPDPFDSLSATFGFREK